MNILYPNGDYTPFVSLFQLSHTAIVFPLENTKSAQQISCQFTSNNALNIAVNFRLHSKK